MGPSIKDVHKEEGGGSIKSGHMWKRWDGGWPNVHVHFSWLCPKIFIKNYVKYLIAQNERGILTRIQILTTFICAPRKLTTHYFMHRVISLLYFVSVVAQYSFCSLCSSHDVETLDFLLLSRWKNTHFKSFLNKKLPSKLHKVKSAVI